ncbi:MAG: CcoQ/FixQ family Cbb3-type cytochrome c oxidase assembly chaperone [Magnetococcales bacterium]|nr:CcoQ/FixQ family Cbb3-type cytochrome c oxidase assembly chaperone [Magnetococcales bacterium]
MLWSKEFALILFFLLFVGIVVWAFWPGNRVRFQQEGEKILEEGDEDLAPTAPSSSGSETSTVARE